MEDKHVIIPDFNTLFKIQVDTTYYTHSPPHTKACSYSTKVRPELDRFTDIF